MLLQPNPRGLNERAGWAQAAACQTRLVSARARRRELPLAPPRPQFEDGRPGGSTSFALSVRQSAPLRAGVNLGNLDSDPLRTSGSYRTLPNCNTAAFPFAIYYFSGVQVRKSAFVKFPGQSSR